MRRRYSLGHLILAVVVALSLTPLMVAVDAQGQIAFVSNRDGNWEIYVMDVDGGNQQNLTNHRAWDGSPSWSPDGKRIAFLSRRDGHAMHGIPTSDIYVMDADGSNPQNLTNNPAHDGSPCWSPDGKRIAFDSDREGRFNWEIYVMDADGGNLQRLTNNPDDDGHPDDRYPSWSPDGKRIVFSARREGHVEVKFDVTYEIYVMDTDGGNQQNLTNNRVLDWGPSWSPDSKRIAFKSWRDGNSEIYVMDADGQNPRRLTNNRRYDSHPSWSPDGKRIAFLSGRGRKSEIYVMDADGSNLGRITNNGHSDINPAWSGPAFAVGVAPFEIAPASKMFTMWGWLKQVDR